MGTVSEMACWRFRGSGLLLPLSSHRGTEHEGITLNTEQSLRFRGCSGPTSMCFKMFKDPPWVPREKHYLDRFKPRRHKVIKQSSQHRTLENIDTNSYNSHRCHRITGTVSKFLQNTFHVLRKTALIPSQTPPPFPPRHFSPPCTALSPLSTSSKPFTTAHLSCGSSSQAARG